MAIVELFSMRQKRERGELPDTYRHDVLPERLRVQLVHIWAKALGRPWDTLWDRKKTVYSKVTQLIREGHGFFRLPHRPGIKRLGGEGHYDDYQELIHFFLDAESIEVALDVVEILATELSNDLAGEVNQRLREHGIGYQLEQGRMVPISSDLLHQEAVRPALQLLSAAPFQAAGQEFLTAHEHYRHGRHEEALVAACKAFESTLKIVLNAHHVPIKPTAAAQELVNLVRSNNIVPTYVADQHLMGVAILRNKLAGHGQGEAVRQVDEAYVRYALHLAAAAIVFLVDLSKRPAVGGSR